MTPFGAKGLVLRAGLLAGMIAIPACTGCQSEPDAPATTQSSDVSVPEFHPEPREKPPEWTTEFRPIGAESGLDFERFDDISRFRRILEVNGGGVAVFDLDADGFLDIFFTNGCRLPIDPDDRQHKCELFHNRGGLKFQRITNEAGLFQLGYAYGCAVGDYNADGFDDLYVTALGRNALWQNNGDGTLTEVTGKSGTEAEGWGASAAFADFNGDGHLDLYVVNYLLESDRSPRLCENPVSPDGYESCSPSLFEGVDDVLLISDGKGGFLNATNPAGLSGLKGKGLGVVVSDFDGDGEPDIYVANDGEANFLLTKVAETSLPELDPQEGTAREGLRIPRYENRATLGGVALNEAGYAQASMGVACGDYNADGRPDLFLTHFHGDTNTLYANQGGLLFDDATRKSQLGPSSRQKLGWGTCFFDPDNDGWLDLFVANGHIEDRSWQKFREPYQMRPQIYRNRLNGTFQEVSDWSGPYFQAEWLGRGVAAGDLDRDQKVDLVVSHQLAPSLALHNQTETPHQAIMLRLAGSVSNRNGYGARVEIPDRQPPFVRELIGGGSFQSASSRELHLGLGESASATIRIRWPSGRVETHKDMAPGQWMAIEGQGILPLP
jgi:hypothetical protein